MAECDQLLKKLEMLQSLRISHVLIELLDWEKLTEICDELGYDKSGIVKNCLQGFFKKNRDFYAEFGVLDAKARGISSSEHFTILKERAEEDLPSYQEPPPNPSPTPLDEIYPLPLKDDYRQKLTVLKLPAFNYVLLRNAHILHKDSYPQLVGRIIRSHLTEHWEKTYFPQIEREKRNDYI